MSSLGYLCIVPIPPKYGCNFNNKFASFMCNPILNLAWILQPNFIAICLSNIKLNEPSASIKLVQNQDEIFKVEYYFLFNWLERFFIW